MSGPDHHHVYSSLLQGLAKTKIPRNSIIAISITASSTDHYPIESSVQDTLNPFDRYEYIQRALYWSSTGQSDPEVPETLVYRLKASLCTSKRRIRVLRPCACSDLEQLLGQVQDRLHSEPARDHRCWFRFVLSQPGTIGAGSGSGSGSSLWVSLCSSHWKNLQSVLPPCTMVGNVSIWHDWWKKTRDISVENKH